MNTALGRPLPIVAAVVALLLGMALVVAAKSDQVMLFQHGTPEVPQARAFAVMNPFRDRGPERTAEGLMSDLRTSRCTQILSDLHSDDSRICPIMSENKKVRLIWRKDESTTRLLVYHLRESDSNLWISSHRHEMGFVVDGVSLVR